MAKYDVYWTYVKYADNPKKGKRRPVVQIKDDQNERGAFAKITSSKKGVKRKHAIRITNLQSAGLYNDPSAVQLNNRLVNKPELKYAGSLAVEDIRRLRLHEALDESQIEYRFAEEFDDNFTISSMLED